MNILLVSHTFPYPPNEGIKSPLFNLLKEFSKANKVVLVSFIKKEEEKYLPIIRNHCDEVIVVNHNLSRNVFSRVKSVFLDREPYFVKQFFNIEFFGILKSKIQSQHFDVIFFDFINTVVYRERISILSACKCFLHLHDAMSMLYYRNFTVEKNLIKRFYWFNQYKKILYYENKLQNYFFKITVVSQKDKEWLVEKSKIPCEKIEVVPNGIDLDFFRSYSCEEVDKFRKELSINFPAIIFRGIMNFQPNIDACLWFLQNVFPLLKKDIPEIKFCVVGPNPPKKVLKYRSEDIIVTGYVEDIRKYMVSCDVNVCPMISGSGIKNKIMEAMALGKPSVVTSIATEGIPELKNGENILIADSPEEFAEKIKMLLNNSLLYEKIAVSGRKIMEEKYNWSDIAEKFIKIFKEIK